MTVENYDSGVSESDRFAGAPGTVATSGKAYSTPRLVIYGDIRDLTLASASQNRGMDNPMFPRLMT